MAAMLRQLNGHNLHLSLSTRVISSGGNVACMLIPITNRIFNNTDAGKKVTVVTGSSPCHFLRDRGGKLLSKNLGRLREASK